MYNGKFSSYFFSSLHYSTLILEKNAVVLYKKLFIFLFINMINMQNQNDGLTQVEDFVEEIS